MSALTMNPYCERCGHWTSKREFILPGGVLQNAETHLAQGDLTALLALRPGTCPTSLRNLVLNISLCPKCDQTAFLSVQVRTVEVD